MGLSTPTTWVVSGAIGLATFTGGMLIASQSSGATLPAQPQPAVTVTAAPEPGGGPTVRPSTSPTPTEDSGNRGKPSPVSPPSAETPED